MTVKELKEQLNNFPDHMDVFLVQSNSEFAVNLLERVYIKEITFVDGILKAKDDCVVLTDEF
jgi:hypothetical protein